jgi:hypothetical protein
MACDICDRESADNGYVRVFETLKQREEKLYSYACDGCYTALKEQNKKDLDRLIEIVREAKDSLHVDSYRVLRDQTINLRNHLRDDPICLYRPCMG